MNDEAAESRGPSRPSQDVPASAADASTPPATSTPAPDETQATPEAPATAEMPAPVETPATAETAATAEVPATETAPAAETPASAGTATGSDEPPTADLRTEAVPDDPQPESGPRTQPGAGDPPPWFPPAGDPHSGPFFSRDAFSREKLVRPRQGRYVAGVCGALARATNTDPVLWRVLLAVLGLLSGVGVLLYLIGWLVMPAEGDTASPIESLLGKGRSGMAPASVVLLGGAAVLTFAFIMQDGVRASLLACAVIVGAILLIKRSGAGQQGGPAGTFPAAGQPPTAPPASPPGPFEPTAFDKTAQFGAVPPPPGPATATAPPAQPVGTPSAPPPPPPYAPPPSGYRPPFAPHGPYARPTPVTYPPAPPAPPVPPLRVKPPKPPRERSKLGRLTFFAALMVIGVIAAIDTAGASVAVSVYFAGALITVALGLIVGAWLGRARGLIALGILLSIGLTISTGAERWGGEFGNSIYRPASPAAVADRYDFTAGSATLDLRQVNFTGQEQNVVVTMKFGQIRVLLPENVDTTALMQVKNGRAVIFGKQFQDGEINGESLTDLGRDGAGGGTLKLDLQMDTGNVEVIR
ncbi:MAG: PspC domain-containing protein [Actinomycetota bacterium]|nr:PspC domain-containing protein [Actinomycetota bacterium]